MTDRVIPLPGRLERAAVNIKEAISKRNGPIQDWIEANIELAEALIEARHEFGDNDAAFGAWCRYNGLTKDVLGKVNGWRSLTWAQILKECVRCCKKPNGGQFHLSTNTNGPFPKLGKVIAI